MKFSTSILPALLLGSPCIITAQSQPLILVESPRFCAGAAQSVERWGWTDGLGDPSTLSRIVSAVNRQLRASEGRLSAGDVAKLRESATSADPCVRELSLGILKTQTGNDLHLRSTRVADAGKRFGLRTLLPAWTAGKPVTRLSEKQSPTREAITP